MYKECIRCHRPLSDKKYFILNDKHCNACQKKYLKENCKRKYLKEKSNGIYRNTPTSLTNKMDSDMEKPYFSDTGNDSDLSTDVKPLKMKKMKKSSDDSDIGPIEITPKKKKMNNNSIKKSTTMTTKHDVPVGADIKTTKKKNEIAIKKSTKPKINEKLILNDIFGKIFENKKVGFIPVFFF
jgi:hypothetical protein